MKNEPLEISNNEAKFIASNLYPELLINGSWLQCKTPTDHELTYLLENRKQFNPNRDMKFVFQRANEWDYYVSEETLKQFEAMGRI